ncbi:MAG: class I tRNA ligase family protein, partial [Candidatus Omnitrophica bacterium]|nr:class I tRNA ligase family protein [Candidatus Omnitrophota bacterium]
MTFFDTADTYGNGLGETILAKALGPKRDQLVIGTKVGYDFYHGTSRRPFDSAQGGVPSEVEGRREGKVECKIFTTRPDTLFGATYLVLSPEHPLVPLITTEARRPVVEDYRQEAARKSELDRTDLAKDKSGVFTGAYAVNPVNQEKIPVWIADYVLASYGTGAIMAVPAHDQRDLEFALQFGLDVRIVIVPGDRPLELAGLTQAYEDPGRMHDSGPFTGLPSEEGKESVVEWLKARGLGEKTINYKLRDWLFSRQRYWGEPIPIVHCKKCGAVPISESQLPLLLPEMKDFTPIGTTDPPSFGKAQDGALSEVERAPLARAKD